MFQRNTFHLALAAAAALTMAATAAQDDNSLGGTTADPGSTLVPGDKDSAPAPCNADLNGDGRIDVLDLIEVITGWGACPLEPDIMPWPVDQDTDDSQVQPEQGSAKDESPSISNVDGPDAERGDDGELAQSLPCQGDVNGDGYVDTQDLVEVFLNFGNDCP